MTAVLTRIDDPRDNLAKARRETDLIPFLRANGIQEFEFAGRKFTVNNAPGEVIRGYLRQRGLTNVKIMPSQLGQPPGYILPGVKQSLPMANNQSLIDVADFARHADLSTPPADPKAIQQVPAESRARPTEPVSAKSPAQMTIVELGNEMKRLKIKRDRRDNMITMRQKIEDHLAGNG